MVTGIDAFVLRDFNLDEGKKTDIIEALVNVTTTTPGLYRVAMSYKYNATWEVQGTSVSRDLWQTVTNETQLSAGTNIVPMWISGRHLMDTPNITVWINVYKGAFPGLPFTWTYEVTNGDLFETPDLTLFSRRHTERGVDLDGDDLFDLLKVDVGLDVTYPGSYELTAVLFPTGTLMDFENHTLNENINRLLLAKKAAKVSGKWVFDQGTNNAIFHFDGRLLNAWGHDGSFTCYVYWTGPAPFLSTIFGFLTAEFRADDFTHPVPPLELGDRHTDRGVNVPGSKLYQGLDVAFNVHVNIPGTYTAFAILQHDGQDIAYARVKKDMDKGFETISIKFPGQAIFLSKLTGTFTAVVWVQGEGFKWNDTTLVQPMTATHVTREYKWDEFAPPQFEVGRKDPQPVEELNFILLKTGIMAVRVARDNPDLTFYLTEDDGSTALLRVVYSRLLAFADDNGDGAPQAAEITYTSALWSYDWEMTEVSLVEDTETGRMASFDLSATVDLVEHSAAASDGTRPLSTVKEFARITLSFSMTSRDMNRTDDVGTYVVLGGTELKVDIRIDVLTPVEGIDFLTVEQVLKDDRGNYRPQADRSDGANSEDGTSDEPKKYTDSAELKQRVEFRESSSVAGFYSWVKKAVLTRSDGTEEVTAVHAAYIMTDGRMILYLSYPYDVETASIYHDPSLGIFEDGFPFIPEEWRALFDPMLFGMASIAAVAVVYGLRGRGRRPEDEELEWDHEPLEPPQAALDVTPVPTQPLEPPQPDQPMHPVPPQTPHQLPDAHPDGWTDWED